MTLAKAPRRLIEPDTHEDLVHWTGCDAAAGDSAGKTARIVADYLRHGLCHLAADDSDTARAVHIHQLLAAVRRQLSSWLPEPDLPPWVLPEDGKPQVEEDVAAHLGVKDLALHTLKKLELLGDCGHRGAGYYLATPARLIPLPSGAALVAGALPTTELTTRIGMQPIWAGLARAFPSGVATRAFESLPRQELHAWAGFPKQPLADWTESYFAEARKKAISTAGLDASSFEVYAPHLQAHQGQHFRWVTARNWRPPPVLTEAPYCLCRTRARPYRYWIAPAEEGTAEFRYRREWSVPAERARRLLYGIDLRCGHSVSVRVSRVRGGLRGEREVKLSSWPAWEEYQTLSALAYDTTPPQGPYLPICFRVTSAWWPDVRTFLEGLGMRIREDT